MIGWVVEAPMIPAMPIADMIPARITKPLSIALHCLMEVKNESKRYCPRQLGCQTAKIVAG
jgi:hypothetical protein